MAERGQSAYSLARLIKRVRRQLSNAIRVELEPVGVSLPTVQIIKRIVASGDLSQLEVAQEIELEPGALCRLVADLEAQHLLTRRRDPRDKRRVLMAPTASGAALLARAQPRIFAAVETMFARLTAREQRELCRLLEKVASDEEPVGRSAAARRPRAPSRPRLRAGS